MFFGSAPGSRMKRGNCDGSGSSARIILPSLGAAQLQRQRKALVRHEGERMRRIDRHRRQDREYLVQEIAVEPGLLGAGQLARIDHGDAGLAQQLAQFAPMGLLVAHQLAAAAGDGGQLLGRRQAVGAGDGNAGPDLAAQAGDPHHVEFVEVVGGDREEAQPLEQRMVGVAGFVQHALIEGEPGQLAIDEAVGRRPSRS